MRGQRSVKVGCLVAGMAAGADSIDDMGLLRHGATGVLFSGGRALSTLGSHLRSYTWGNVLQLEQAGRELLARLGRQAPLLPGADVLAFVDSPFELIQAEQHRGHAIIEQLLTDLNDGPLAHLPSGKFSANAAWLAIAAIAHNPLRAAGTLAGRRHARARAGGLAPRARVAQPLRGRLRAPSAAA